MNICVYCSSSSVVDSAYFAAARRFGALIGSHGHDLVWGGAHVGLMGEVAAAAKRSGAKLRGVMPRRIADHNLGYDGADEFILTETMAERKALMEDLGDAFVALPGGFGTLEEIIQVMTLKQLGYLDAPVVLLNTIAPGAPNGFYQPLLAYFESLYSQMFAKAAYRQLYGVAADSHSAMELVESYRPGNLPNKWFGPKDATEGSGA